MSVYPTAIKRTVLECGRVALAKLGHDPYGMLLSDRRWREVVRITWRGHLDWLNRR